jgi:tetratricopeptide (TPR) repeat protein
MQNSKSLKLLTTAAGVCLTLTTWTLPPALADQAQPDSAGANAPVVPGADAGKAATADVVNNPTTPVGTTDSVTTSADSQGKVIVKPGMPITVNMAAEDLQPTDDAELARQQADAYPDNAEAAFIYAVALTRTSRVEDALKQVRHAKNLARDKGGPAYFDKMIGTYEHMLEYCPDDNRIRYTLAWAYYMKAYLLSKSVPNTVPDANAIAAAAKNDKDKSKNVNTQMAGQVLAMLSPQLAQNVPSQGKISTSNLPHIPSALEQAPPSVAPQVKKYYESALKNLDDLLTRKPDDIWARVYRAHLSAECTGDLGAAMKVWEDCAAKNPQNPAPYFFLAEAYLRLGNLKESLSNISRAIALRALNTTY